MAARNPSAITASLAVDPALVQSADFEFDADDRQYIDNQIRGVEQHLVSSLIKGVHATYVRVDGASASLVVGDVVCLASSSVTEVTVTKAVAAALTNAKAAFGVVLLAAAPGSLALVALGGAISPTVTGLAASAAGYVRVNTTTARCEKVATLGSSDYTVGAVDDAGWLAVSTQMSAGGSGGSTPTGTGFRHVTSGTEDAASKLVVNADVDAAADIALTKLAPGTADYVARTNVLGTATEWAKLDDSNIASGAGIDGTKIAPNFGTQVVGGRLWYVTAEAVESAAGPTTLNNYAIGDYGQLIVSAGTGVVTFSGFAAPAAGQNRMLAIVGDPAGNGFSLLDRNGGSSAANQISVLGGLTGTTMYGATLVYSHTLSLWCLAGYAV